VHAADQVGAARAKQALRAAYELNGEAPREPPPVLEILR